MEFPTLINVINSNKKNITKALLTKSDGSYTLEKDDGNHGGETNLYISSGWIDLHAHIYDGFTSLGVPADSIGLKKGVHIIADAGSAGEATLGGLTKYIIPGCKTGIKAFLHICSSGLADLNESNDLSRLDIDETVKCAQNNKDLICGIKVRACKGIVGDNGVEPVKMALQAARRAGLPLMVHIGERPPEIADILNLLGKGDIVTHCFNGSRDTPWCSDGSPIPALKQALARGVRLDVGHGAGSFSFDVCKKALKHGLPMFSISTDLHTWSIGDPVHDLATTMTKLHSCGLTLPDTILGVTKAPADILGLSNWNNLNGEIKTATLFSVENNDSHTLSLKDSFGKELIPEEMITVKGIISDYNFSSL